MIVLCLCYSYVKRFVNWIKHKEETDEDVYTRWEKDFDLIPLSLHGLFFEYLELGEISDNNLTSIDMYSTLTHAHAHTHTHTHTHSGPVWLCDSVCGSLPPRSSVCSPQQLV